MFPEVAKLGNICIRNNVSWFSQALMQQFIFNSLYLFSGVHTRLVAYFANIAYLKMAG